MATYSNFAILTQRTTQLLELWLDASVFGKNQLTDNPPYANLAEEQAAYMEKMQQPQLMSKELSRSDHFWEAQEYTASLELYLPSYSNISKLSISFSYEQKNSMVSGQRSTEQAMPAPELSAHLQGVKAEYEVRVKLRPLTRVHFTGSYQARPGQGELILQHYSAELEQE